MLGIGQRIGNYRVRRKLGQGGMGVVFEAVHEEIGRRAAIKILLEEFGRDQQSVQRFFNEARAVNIIEHPGLVGIFESGRLEDGSAYIVMEYLDGELLGARLKRLEVLGVAATLSLGRQIASALAAAHQKGIVHRDLKPDNIMIIADPETVGGERIKVFDFGLAKLRSTSPTPHPAPPGAFRTKSGMIMGTPTHMSPEQCRGLSEIDGKADVYALGVLLFEMLIGHAPFMAPSVGELISMHLRDQPPSLRKLDKGIPAALSDLVAGMLKKQPTERPEMLEVVEQLEALGAHRSALALPSPPTASMVAELEVAKTQAAFTPPSTARSATITASIDRHRLPLLLGLLGVLVLGCAGFLFLAFRRSSPPPSVSSSAVTFMIDSEPPGAEIIRIDSGEVVGHTPWFRSDKPRDELLRLHLRLSGFYDSTVIINQAQNSNQKVTLERQAKSEPSTPAVVAGTGLVARRMRWIVSSQPVGAEVILANDGQVLGKTPWTHEQEPENGVLKIFLQLPGYTRTSVLLDLSEGSRQTIILLRTGSQPRPTKTQPPASRPGAPGPSGSSIIREPASFSPVY